jgi:hypothetical protein
MDTGKTYYDLTRERDDALTRVEELKEIAKCAIDWIDAVPSETPLPVMPGFDRDWFDNVIDGVEYD